MLTAVTLFSIQVYWIVLQLCAAFFIFHFPGWLFIFPNQLQIHGSAQRPWEHPCLFSCQRNCLLTATPSFLSITIYKPTGGHLLPPENWQKPSLFSKQKARYSIKSFSESQVLWIVGTFMDIPNMGYLLCKELPNSSALSLEKRQQERVMKEVCKIKSIVTKRMRSKELPHCFLKANSWNEARVKPQSQAQHYQEEVSHHTVAVDVVEARIYRLQGEDGKVQRHHFQLRLSPS